MSQRLNVSNLLSSLARQMSGLELEVPFPTLPTSEQTSIKLNGDFDAGGDLSAKLLSSFQRALQLDHKLPDWIIGLNGMSGKKYRYFINRLIESIEDPCYLEVGSWAGSTACSAISGNKLSVLCIDNWSLFGGPKDAFFQNINRAKNERCDFRFLEADFRQVDFADLDYRANVYLFDGPHEEADQRDGILAALPALQNEFVLLVDDYNWEEVRNGTATAITEGNLSVTCSIEIRTTTDNSHPLLHGANSDWHNGYYLAHVVKT